MVSELVTGFKGVDWRIAMKTHLVLGGCLFAAPSITLQWEQYRRTMCCPDAASIRLDGLTKSFSQLGHFISHLLSLDHIIATLIEWSEED